MTDSLAEAPDEGSYVRRLLILLALLALAALVFGMVRWASHGVLTVLAGVLWGVVLDGSANFVARHTRMPRWLAMILLGIVGLTGVGLFWWWMGSALASEFDGLVATAKQAWGTVQAELLESPWGARLLSDVSGMASAEPITSRIGGVVTSTAGALGSIILIFFFGVYFAIDPKMYVEGALHLVPYSSRPRLRYLAVHIGSALRSWMVGRFVSMTIVGIGTGIGLWIAGVPMALGLAIIAGTFSFVPNLGPAAAMIPGTLIGFSHDMMTGVWAAVVYLSVQAVETYVLTPWIEQRVVSLPPALLLAVQLMMGLSTGILGLLLATPIAVGGIVAIQVLYIRDVLEDPIPLLGEHEGQRPRHGVRRRSRGEGEAKHGAPHPSPERGSDAGNA